MGESRMKDNFCEFFIDYVSLTKEVSRLEEKIKEIEEENNNLKQRLFSCKQNVFAELNQETAESNEILLQIIADLEIKINKMRNCANCRWKCTAIKHKFCVNYSKWELAE